MKVDICVVTKDPDFVLPQGVGGIPVNDVIVETSNPLAKARQYAIEKVTTDWFVFLDDDIILPSDWWFMVSDWIYEDLHYLETSTHLNGKPLGAIQGTAIPYGLGETYDLAFRKHFAKSPSVKELNGNDRMFTHNTLIRTSAVRDWNPPGDLSSWEDYDMMRHIMEEKGYRVFVVKTETYHKYSWNRIWTTARWGTKGRLRFHPKKDIIKDFAGTPITFLKDGWCIGLPNFIRAFASMYEMIVGGRRS